MIYAFLDYELDTHLYELRGPRGLIALEPQVYDVLSYLLLHRDRVVPKLELLERLWPDRYVSDGALSHCVMLVRKAVGDTGLSQRCIKTIHRRGYRFVAKLHKQQAEREAGAECLRPSAPYLAPVCQPQS